MTLAWTPPEQNGGSLTRYEYAIAEGYQGHYSEWQVIPSNGITTESLGANYIVTGLHAYAVYRLNPYSFPNFSPPSPANSVATLHCIIRLQKSQQSPSLPRKASLRGSHRRIAPNHNP